MHRDRPVRRRCSRLYTMYTTRIRAFIANIIIMADGRNGENFLGIKTNAARIKTNRHDAFSFYVVDTYSTIRIRKVFLYLLNARIGYVLYSIVIECYTISRYQSSYMQLILRWWYFHR